MKQRVCQKQEDLDKAAKAIQGLGGHLPVVVSVTEGNRIRSSGQNSRYWANLNDRLNEINQALSQIEENGYTNLEARQVIANELESSAAAILYAPNAEAIHGVLKLIAGIPTSTRLGTKAFSKYEELMEREISQIVGDIRAVAARA